METIPVPTDPAVTLRQKPAHRMAAIRYRGRWSEANYQNHLEKLKSWMDAQGLRAAGPPVWARYNAPFVPWFLRRNEILIPIEQPLS
jgi:effector-binding domain-containing protein